MHANEHISLAQHEQIMLVTINRPNMMNALAPATHLAMEQAFDQFERDEQLRVAILTGAGSSAFCAGGDISVMAQAQQEEDYAIPATGYGGLTRRSHCHKPIIAAVNGLALGGGFEIALACDLIVAAEHASFGLPEPMIGTAAVGGGLHRLVRQIGLKPAMQLLLTGRSIDAQRALQLGLVNEVVPQEQLLDTAFALARQILRCAPLAVAATKQVAMASLDFPSLEAALQAQADKQFPLLEQMFKSDDIREGLNAFMEKRKPVWRGH